MFAFIARQPILDKTQALYAYELVFRDGINGSFPEHDTRKEEVIKTRFNTLSIDEISGDNRAFIQFQTDTLVNRFPSDLDAEKVIIELKEKPSTSQALMETCKTLNKNGFTLALSETNTTPLLSEDLALIDVLKLNAQDMRKETLGHDIGAFHDASIQLVANNVHTLNAFSEYSNAGFDYFQGYFFTQPTVKSAQTLPASSLTLLELMSVCMQAVFDFDKVTSIIERDASVSFLLMRYINNPLINKRAKISSIEHALTFLGEVEAKKFIALLSLASLTEDKPLELLQVSLVRAKFCEFLALKIDGKVNKTAAFIVGLFSLLDTILEQDMPVILTKMQLAVEINNALMGLPGELKDYLRLAKSFESATWATMIGLSEQLAVSQRDLHEIFNESIRWGNQMQRSLSPHFPKTKA